MAIASNFVRALVAKTLASMPSDRIQRHPVPSVDDIPHGRSSIEVPMWTGDHGASDALAYAERRWGPRHSLNIKDAVGAISSSDIPGPGVLDNEFFHQVLQESILGRLAGLRRVPFAVRTLKATNVTRGYWISEFQPIPLSKRSLAGSSLPRRKIGAIVCATIESLQAEGPAAEGRLEEDLRRAVATVLDAAFIDVTNAGIEDKTPAAVTYDHDIPSQGNPAEDIAALIASFGGDLASAVFVTDPRTASEIALARDAGGAFAFPDCGPRGGSLLGIPLLTSRGSPRDSSGGQLALIDPSGIAAAIDSIEMTRSTSATLNMTDEPEASGEAGELVSLFMTETAAFKTIVSANWENQRDDGAIVVTGCSYAVSQS